MDTNVLIYAALGRVDEPIKWERAHRLIELEQATVPSQVLAEFYAVSTGPKHRLDPTIAALWAERLAMMPTVNLDADLVLEGIALSRRYQINYWDGAVLAACHRCAAGVLYTEDLSHDQVYGAVRVIDPFR